MPERFCPNCGNKLSLTEKFCDQCGQSVGDIVEEKVEKPTSVEAPTKPSTLFNENFKQIISHLEFLGYTMKYVDAEGVPGKQFVLALSEKHGNILLTELVNGATYFQITWTTNKKVVVAMNPAINEANLVSDVSKVYFVTEDGLARIRFDSYFCGEYSKSSFGKFYEMMTNDEQRVFAQEDFKKVFLN